MYPLPYEKTGEEAVVSLQGLIYLKQLRIRSSILNCLKLKHPPGKRADVGKKKRTKNRPFLFYTVYALISIQIFS